HPILSNFGKVGRETFRVFEEEDFVLEDHYAEKEEEGALASMQHGILHFEKTTPQQDQSFLLLPAPSKLREVEILFARLLEMDVKPTDIQVFSPEIAKYAPLIETVFGADDSPFPYAIYDLPEQPLLQTFFELLSLDRFEKEALYKLFTSPYFAPLGQSEAVEFFSWVNRSGVKWGVDQAHRKTILPDLLEETESGTWKEAFDALLKNLVFVPEKGTDWDLPYLDFSNAELFGRAITLVESLRKDIDFLKSASLPGEKWAEHLIRIFNYYLSVEKGAYSVIQEKLSFLKDLEGMFTFASIKRYLANSLKQKKGIRGTRNLEVVTFRSLRPGTVLSSKVIAVLGMNEGDFPRPFVASSLNLLGKESDYAPSSPDEDRYLFLELLMNAGEKLMMTYQNMSEEDGRERPPSVLVQELDPLIEADPPFPFHRDYFSKERIYPMRHFLAAQEFYSGDKKEPFIPEYLHKTALPNPQKMERPTLQELSRFAKNPIRFYCNQILNLYLHFEDN
ncbi:MAG: exodeoxyribonuclease V subunit gamma, partial [Chlamydiia bacterium]|nr:exodeoxyribonuclease V subunit gamma [Chlamydiia bacterium]